jgi:hypothetical protein
MPGALEISLSPKVPEPIWRQFGIARRVLNITVPEPRLQRPGIVPFVGKLVATAVAQHVGMDREGHAGPLAETSNQGMETLGRHWRATLGYKDVRAWCLFSLQAT